MRIVSGGIQHETNTFSVIPTTVAEFVRDSHFGDDLGDTQQIKNRFQGTNTIHGGYLRGADELGVELLPVLNLRAYPEGMVTRETFEYLLSELLEHRKRTLAEGHARLPWVFCTKGGELLRKNNVRSSSYMGILKRANQKFTEQAEKKGVIPELLPIIRFHDLRHTAATIMLSQGVHPKIVQERLGHSTISMTLATYSHVLPTMQKEAAEKLDRLYRTVGA